MITKEQALFIANAYIEDKNKKSKYVFLLQLEKTIEFKLGWVFFYQTKEFIETGDLFQSAVGNAPIIVDNRTGAVTVTGTRFGIKKYIEEYLKREGEL
jgi:hypothetical protein